MPKSLLPIKHFIQKYDVGCLAACTQMALHYLGIETTQKRLNQLFEVGELGTPNWRIRRVADVFPVSVALNEQGDESDLIQYIQQHTPVIIFLLTGELSYWDVNIQHAILVVGFDDTYFYVNDPAFPDAPKPILINELMIAWIEFDTQFAVISS
jgi:ABC-type bacteriocin/lantibiotic exporter with double-glycine peptidase domain